MGIQKLGHEVRERGHGRREGRGQGRREVERAKEGGEWERDGEEREGGRGREKEIGKGRSQSGTGGVRGRAGDRQQRRSERVGEVVGCGRGRLWVVDGGGEGNDHEVKYFTLLSCSKRGRSQSRLVVGL